MTEGFVDSLAAWLSMGGYAAFVWPAYGIAAAALSALTIKSLLRYRGAQARIAQILDEQERASP